MSGSAEPPEDPTPRQGRNPGRPAARLGVVAGLLALLAWGPAASAQGLGAPARAEATLSSRVEGRVVRVAIAVAIHEGWHLYHDELGNEKAIGLPTIVELQGDGITWSAVRFPEPFKLDQSDVGGTWIWSHHGNIVLYAAGRLAEGADGQGVRAHLKGLTCQDNGSCIPYQQSVTRSGPGADALFEAFPADLVPSVEGGGTTGGAPVAREGAVVAGGTARPIEAGGRPGRPAAVDYDAVSFPDFVPQSEPSSRGLGLWLLVAFVAGMILNVMPCVLPVISIKVLSFVQQAGEDRRRVAALGMAFAAGIVVVFLGLAALAAFAGQSWGEQFQNQTFLVVMLGLVFAFGLSMFGVYELGVPAGVGGLAAGPPREGMGDAFFKGMLATALATPCSGPFLGSTLTWTLAQPAAVVFGIFISLGLGMALPYVVLTANPALLKLVPRPGPWMDTFKQAMGFVLMATVVYLMISLRQDLLLYTAAFLVFVGLGCWTWGRFSRAPATRRRRLVVLTLAVAVVAGGARFSFGTLRGLFEQDESVHGWVAFDPLLLQESLASGRSVFVDFTADWCPNCKANEKWTYEAEAVQARMAHKGVLAMKADITRDSPRTTMIERLMRKLGARSIPFMAVFPADRPLQPVVRPDMVREAEFLSILDSLPDPDV